MEAVEKSYQRETPVPVVIPEYGVYVFESYHSPDFQMRKSIHDFHEIGIVISGKGKLTIKGDQQDEYELLDHCLFFIPAGMSHIFRDHKNHPLTIQMICFKDQIFYENNYLKQVITTFKNKFKLYPVSSLGKSYSFKKIMQLFKEMIFEQTQKEVGHEIKMRMLVSSLLIFFNRLDHYNGFEVNVKEQAFLDSLNFLHMHFYKSPSIESLSRMAGQSYRTYTDSFKKKMGKTVVEYVTELKLEYAKKRLRESGSIKFSAYDAGFNDLANFYRVFKKFTGKTPKQFLGNC